MKGAISVSVLGLLFLTSCELTGRAFVDKSIGYAVTRGEVLRVENLVMQKSNHLNDGVVLRVDEVGCMVSIKMGDPVQVIEMKPGSLLVLGEKEDWVLQPYGGQTAENVQQSEESFDSGFDFGVPASGE